MSLESIMRPSIGAVPQWPGVVGKVLYVSHSKGVNASGRGHDPSAALATITYALGLCTDGNNDYILVLDAWQEASPIIVNKKSVHIIGIQGLTPNTRQPCMAPDVDAAVFAIDGPGDMCEIAGFTLGGGTNHGCIEVHGGGPYGGYIHDCVLGHPFCGGTPLHGIWDAGLNFQSFRFERLIILGNGGFGGGTITGYGIFCDGGPWLHTQIVKNYIMGVDVCIWCDNMDGGLIADNILAPNANTLGGGITLLSGCHGNVIANNVANFGDTTMVQNPYEDQADAGDNHWSGNMKGAAFTDPV